MFFIVTQKGIHMLFQRTFSLSMPGYPSKVLMVSTDSVTKMVVRNKLHGRQIFYNFLGIDEKT